MKQHNKLTDKQIAMAKHCLGIKEHPENRNFYSILEDNPKMDAWLDMVEKKYAEMYNKSKDVVHFRMTVLGISEIKVG